MFVSLQCHTKALLILEQTPDWLANPQEVLINSFCEEPEHDLII